MTIHRGLGLRPLNVALRLSVFERVQQQNAYIYRLLVIYIYLFRHCDTLYSYCIQIFTRQDRRETYISFIGCAVCTVKF